MQTLFIYMHALCAFVKLCMENLCPCVRTNWYNRYWSYIEMHLLYIETASIVIVVLKFSTL